MISSGLFNSIAVNLGDLAYANYAAHISEIDRVRQGIAQNRNGQLPLTDITTNRNRLDQRIAREGGVPERLALERINGVPDFQDMAIIRKILRASTSVGRIIIQDNTGIRGYGTGCLVAPNVLITNNHVLPDVDSASRSLVQFNYELGDNGQILTPVTFRLRPDLFFLTAAYTQTPGDKFSGRDFTLVGVEPTNDDGASLSQFGFIKLDRSLGKIIEGENCVVIQHPKGDYKKIVLKDIRLLTLTDNFLIYEADTLPGSSGSLVLGLGTGEAVALHHSSVPRKDAAGNWLRKDGRVVQPGDIDDDIDWIGNEGVRVSCLVEAFNNMAVPDSMQSVRSQIIAAQTPTLVVNSLTPAPPMPNLLPTTPARTEATPAPVAPAPPTPITASNLLYFEVVLETHPTLQADWDRRATELVPGMVEQVPLLPASLDSFSQRMRYLTVKPTDNPNPWDMAAAIEALPQVESCRPDLMSLTDVGRSADASPLTPRATESDVIFNDGTAEPNEPKFREKWKDSVQVKAALKQKGANQQRWWNWFAVNWPNAGPLPAGLTPAVIERLAQMRLVQLDTGYSDNSKVAGGYNLDLDFDFIDNDTDARDEEAGFGLKFPDHGTRTASLVVGGPLATDPNNLDGNAGLLYKTGKRLTRLIPYRIAQSVVLIGRGKQVVDGVNYAVRAGADVMFMCMGTYPRPMLDAIAREAYEKGVIWVCAAGNDVELVVALAMYPGTIAVAATNPNDLPWSGSSHGPTVDIAAPGEDVYVPFLDKQGAEIMVYGSGTSYATPQVAAAAMLWKAKNYRQLGQYLPWQVVEAFRTVLKQTARKGDWRVKGYGAGILDMTALLNAPLPDPKTLVNRYQNKPDPAPHSVGIAEAAHFIWNVLRRKLIPGSAESLTTPVLTTLGQQALDAFQAPVPAALRARESSTTVVDSNALLRYYFNQ